MTLVDSNVLMYAAGKEHPNKEPCLTYLEGIALGKREAAIDAEVLQEILHRYRSINRWADGKRVYDLARALFVNVIPITHEVTDAAKALMEAHPELQARDALHAAVAMQQRADICSYDEDFDILKDRLRRIEPGTGRGH